MGEKLEKPIIEKNSYDDENELIIYGITEMQGYKKTMEVFTLRNTNLLEQNQNIFLFGIFDGHNGSEIAKYLSLHFSQFLSENKNFINGDYKQALKETFINIDTSFRALETQLELSKYSSKNIPNLSELNLNEEENKNISKFMEVFEPRNLDGVNIAEFCGSCGIIILITEKTVFIANAGNSKCLPINTKNEIIKDKINKEHIISDEHEMKRLKVAYGFVDDDDENENENNNKKEFNPMDYCPLIITRGFGDLQYKDNKLINIEDQYISVNPDIIEIPIEELNYLIIGNHGSFGENKNNKLTINQTVAKYILDKINNNENKKISEIIGEYFDEVIKQEDKINDDEENIINNMACIVIQFKHENNENNNNIIIEEDKGNNKENENNKEEIKKEKKEMDKVDEKEEDKEEEKEENIEENKEVKKEENKKQNKEEEKEENKEKNKEESKEENTEEKEEEKEENKVENKEENKEEKKEEK